LDLKQTIERCKQRNREAEKELYLFYARYVYSICLRYSKDDVQAEDYMQESFMKIFTSLPKYDFSKGKFESWMSRIVVNLIISDKRKKKLVTESLTDQNIFESEQILVQEMSDDILNARVSRKDLLAAIRQLPLAYRDVLNLYVFDDLSHKDIAELMKIKPSSSRARFSRGKKMLKEILSNKLVTVL